MNVHASVFTWLRPMLLFVLLAGSAFFSAVEMALLSLDRIRIQELLHTYGKAGKLIKKALDAPRETLVTIVLGNTLVNVAFSTLCATIISAFVVRFFGAENELISFLINLLFVSTVILVFGEIVPKYYSAYRADRVALGSIRALNVFAFLVRPVRVLLIGITGFFLRLGGHIEDPSDLFVSEEEIRDALDVGRAQGIIAEHEGKMIHRVFEFGDTQVREVMVPRPDMVCINYADYMKDVINTAVMSGHSRLPAYRGTMDSIEGIVAVKDLLPFMKENFHIGDKPDCIRTAHFVSEAMRLDDCLREMQLKKTRMAIVVDEYGLTAGVVSVEDLIEAVVGDIRDERDREPEHICKIGEGRWRVHGRTPVDRLEEFLGIDIPSGDYSSVAGYLIARFERFPMPGDVLEDSQIGLKFTVDAADRRRILFMVVERMT